MSASEEYFDESVARGLYGYSDEESAARDLHEMRRNAYLESNEGTFEGSSGGEFEVKEHPMLGGGHDAEEEQEVEEEEDDESTEEEVKELVEVSSEEEKEENDAPTRRRWKPMTVWDSFFTLPVSEETLSRMKKQYAKEYNEYLKANKK